MYLATVTYILQLKSRFFDTCILTTFFQTLYFTYFSFIYVMLLSVDDDSSRIFQRSKQNMICQFAVFQIRQSKEQFNDEVITMKKRKETLLNELEDIQLQLIDIQYRLDASKRKPVPTIPIIYPEERHQDPFHVRFSLNKRFASHDFHSSFFQIDEKEVDNIKIGLVQEEEQKYVAGSRMSISSRRSSVSSVANRLKSGGRMGRAKDQAKETASQQHAAK